MCELHYSSHPHNPALVAHESVIALIPYRAFAHFSTRETAGCVPLLSRTRLNPFGVQCLSYSIHCRFLLAKFFHPFDNFSFTGTCAIGLVSFAASNFGAYALTCSPYFLDNHDEYCAKAPRTWRIRTSLRNAGQQRGCRCCDHSGADASREREYHDGQVCPSRDTCEAGGPISLGAIDPFPNVPTQLTETTLTG